MIVAPQVAPEDLLLFTIDYPIFVPMSRVDISSAGFSKVLLPNGMLQTDSALNTTLQTVKDNVGNSSTLLLSTVDAQFNSTLRIHTDSSELLDIEDTGSNNRFNINRVVQKINLDFSSKPTDTTTVVGAIRTATNGSNLADVFTFLENGTVGLNNPAPSSTYKLDIIGNVNASSYIVTGGTSSQFLKANGSLDSTAYTPQTRTLTINGTAQDLSADRSWTIPTYSPPNGLLRTANAISSTLQTVTDYLNNTTSLQLNSGRVGILSDSSVATQTSAVIQATTTNANLVLNPNGTGAIVASIPDGTVIGGNARGINAVDLQISRTAASQVASGNYSFTGGRNVSSTGDYSFAFGSTSGGTNTSATGLAAVAIGIGNTASGGSSVCLGAQSGASAAYSIGIGFQANSSGIAAVSMGYQNSASSNYSTVSGGQSNTASTNTHATVVGGQTNTSSGQWSISGGYLSVASGSNGIGLGYRATASATGSIVIANNDGGGTPQASGNWSNIIGGVRSTATNSYATSLGGYNNTASGFSSYAFGYRTEAYLRGQLTIGEYFTNTNDAQQSLLTARNSAALATGGTLVLSLDGTGTTNLIIPFGTNRAWNVTIKTIAIVTTITGTATGVTVGDAYSEVKYLLFKKVGGTSSIVGTVDTNSIKSNTSMSTCAVTITVGASQEMAITFTAPTFAGGGTVSCRVVSKVELTEVAY